MTDHQKFIVSYKDNVSQDVIDKHIKDIESQGGQVHHRYDTVMKGFAASFPKGHVNVLEGHPDVEYVEADGEVSIN